MLSLLIEPLPNLVLRGARVHLRPLRPRDFRDWQAVRARSRDFLTPWEPRWPEDALFRSCFQRRLRRVVREWRSDQGYAFHIFESSNPERLVGGIGLSYVRRGIAQTASVGYWLGVDDIRRGLMSEALACVVRFAFEELRLHRLEAACLPHNIASRRLLTKTGFMEEGLARHYLKINGAWEDHVAFALLCEDCYGERLDEPREGGRMSERTGGWRARLTGC